MTTYVDFAFTEAEGWTDSEMALSSKSAGRASSGSVASGADTPELVLTLPSISQDDDVAISGIEMEIWATNNGSGSGALFKTVQFRWGPGFSANLASARSFGQVQTSSNYTPTAPVIFGGETNLWGEEALYLGQFKNSNALTIQGVNTASKSRNFTVWDVKGRLWVDVLSMQDVVQRAFRKVAVLSKDEEITGDDLTHGLDLLNDMMFGWEAFGVNINHVEREAGEAFPLARKFVEGTAAQLAERLGSDYQVPAPSSARFFAALSRAYSLDTDADYRDLDGDGVLTEAEIEAAKQARFY